MRSLQDYRDIYKEIASSNNITGDSVELLVQLLANASYISEVENISYMQEASLERCTLVNSKIQHCMNQMYSVFRGRCPRVILKFKPTKYMEFNVYDPIVNSNDFTIYYLGYLKTDNEDESDETDTDETEPGTRNLPIEEGFIYGPCTIMPAIDDDDTYTVIGLMAKEKIVMNWNTTSNNQYYVETLEENLSNDLWVKAGANDSSMDYVEVSRVFSDHILNKCIFDLTTTSYSSRLYFSGIFDNTDLNRDDENLSSPNGNISIQAEYYKFSRVSEYKPAELKKINISGAEMKNFDSTFLEERVNDKDREIAPGVIIISETGRDGIETIHYKANRDRFVSSVIRSNSDVGTVLEEMFPAKVMPYGTNYEFSSAEVSSSEDGSMVSLYYVPKDVLNLLTSSEIDDFLTTKKAYYIVDTIEVKEGRRFTALFNIDIELYNSFSIDSEISEILKNYEKKFNVDLEVSKEEIKTLISKIPNVKQVRGLEISYMDPETADVYSEGMIYDEDLNIYSSTAIPGSEEVIHTIKPDIYFNIDYNINSIIQTRS